MFTVEGQIQHKVTFIRKHVPSDVKIILIGHSIGAYIVVEMIDRLEKDCVIEGKRYD